MFKKIFSGIAILTIAVIAVFNVNFNSQSNDLSGIFLVNVEALANPEELLYVCYGGSTECVRVNFSPGNYVVYFKT